MAKVIICFRAYAVLLAFLVQGSLAYVTRQSSFLIDTPSLCQPHGCRTRPSTAFPEIRGLGNHKNVRPRTTRIQMLPTAVTTSLPLLRKMGIITAITAFVLNFRAILWPKSLPDKKVNAPLPPGVLGCPLVGVGLKPFLGTRKEGKAAFQYEMFKKFPNTSVVRSYMLGTPLVYIAGGEKVKNFLNSEFDDDGIRNGLGRAEIMGDDSILTSSNQKQHSSLRRLIGQAMTPAAVSKSIPTLQETAQKQVDVLLRSEGPVSADDVCTSYTVDFAWKQILGLDLKDDEIPVFEKAVNDWIKGFADLLPIFGIKLGFLPHWKALSYLRSRIGKKIDNLEKNGPDSSTLSGMVFAVDEEGDSRRLTRDQIIDNALVLILAGSETSASTLTMALMLMKLNPQTWVKLVQEQEKMVERHGDKMTKSALDEDCPYLDAVVRETMRLLPIPTGIPKNLLATRIIDGFQIPKGYRGYASPLMTHYKDPTTFQEDGSHMDIRKGFKPERWLNDATRPSSDFIPMGAGPRYCLGSVLAYAEMKVFLATLARNIDYELVGSYGVDDNIEWKRISILPKVLNGVNMVVSEKKIA